MLTGENSIIKRAGDSKEKISQKSLEEEIQFVMSSREINDRTGTENIPLKEDLEKSISDSAIEQPEGHNDIYYIVKGNEKISQNGLFFYT